MSTSDPRRGERARNRRSKRGCKNCRDRHLKCDDTQPSCDQCTRLSLQCSRELIRFKQHFRAIPASKLQSVERINFSAQQQWCSPETPLEFVDESRNLQPKDAATAEDGSRSRVSASDRSEAVKDVTSISDPGSEAFDHIDCRDSHFSSTEAWPHTLASSSYHLEHQQSPPGPLTCHYTLPEQSPTWPSPGPLSVHPVTNLFASSTYMNYMHSMDSVENTGYEEPTETSSDHFNHTASCNGASTWPLKDPHEAELMRYYITNVSRRFDLCDPERHFSLVVPWRAAYCPPLLDAALALSARCLSQITSYDDYMASRYYQRCLNVLIPMLSSPDALDNDDLFAAVVLLRTLEEIEGKHFPRFCHYSPADVQTNYSSRSAFDPLLNTNAYARFLTVPLSITDPHTHLFGSHLFARASTSMQNSDNPLASLGKHSGSSLRRASLMIAFRQEIYTAFVSQRPIDRAFCLRDVDRSLDSPANDCTWTNRILLHIVDALDFCFGEEPLTPAEILQRHAQLSQYASEWYAKKPPSFNAIFYEPGEYSYSEGDGNEGTRGFSSKIWILSDAAATGLLNYHLLRILLISFDPNAPRVGPLRAQFFKQQDAEIKEEVKTLIGLANGNAECVPHFVLASLGIAMAGHRFHERWEQDYLLAFLERAESTHAWSTVAAQLHLMDAWSRKDN